MRKFLSLSLLLLFASGCAMIPKYERPQAPVPAQLPGTGTGLEGAQNPAELPWREFAQNDKLSKLIELALEHNRDLRLAALNAESLREFYKIQRAELYPNLYASGGGARQKSSRHFLTPGQDRRGNHFQADLSLLSWEIDLFGKLRSLSESALQEYFATEEARRGAQIMLVSSLANAYLALAAENESLQLAKDTLQSQQEALDLVSKQFEQGLITELDLKRAQIPRDSARVDVAQYGRQLEQAKNALQFLLGCPMPDELMPGPLSSLPQTAALAPELESEVLLQRPDIMAAEHRLLGALANIGAARAAFFPNISLTSSIGSASTQLSDLFSSGSATWSFAPQLAMPIFDARVWAAHRVSKVQQKLALTQYERAIQNAFRETADSLVLCQSISEQVQAQETLVKALTQTYELARFRYEKGIDNYLSVLDAQRSMFAAQQGLISMRLAEQSSRWQLYSALGGGTQ